MMAVLTSVEGVTASARAAPASPPSRTRTARGREMGAGRPGPGAGPAGTWKPPRSVQSLRSRAGVVAWATTMERYVKGVGKLCSRECTAGRGRTIHEQLFSRLPDTQDLLVTNPQPACPYLRWPACCLRPPAAVADGGGTAWNACANHPNTKNSTSKPEIPSNRVIVDLPALAAMLPASASGCCCGIAGGVGCTAWKADPRDCSTCEGGAETWRGAPTAGGADACGASRGGLPADVPAQERHGSV